MALVSWTLRRRLSLCSTDYFKSRTCLTGRDGVRSMCTANNVRKENIVIVGGGIAGLASAVSLCRHGIGSLVLEQAESLRTQGNAITLSKNGWKALDIMGVGDQVRSRSFQLGGVIIKSDDGKELSSFEVKEDDKSQEGWAVERRVLQETLASKLTPDSIRCSSKLTKIETSENGTTLLQLQDGTRLSAEVVMACDGIWSPTAKWMGFPEAKYAGQICYQGLAYFPQGQPYEPNVIYTFGRGLRVGYFPASQTKVHWHIACNNSSPGPRITDPSILRQEAAELVKNWPLDMLNLINRTADDTISKVALFDRWLWPLISPPPYTGRIVLVGDAWHPMTPNLGQGACCALEDSVVLTEKLAKAINSKHFSVEDAFKSYATERWRRVFPITVTANLVGKLLHSQNGIVSSIRDKSIVPKLRKIFTRYTNIDFDQTKQK